MKLVTASTLKCIAEKRFNNIMHIYMYNRVYYIDYLFPIMQLQHIINVACNRCTSFTWRVDELQ